MKRKNNGIHLLVDYQGRRVVSGVLGKDRVFHKNVETSQKLFCMNAYGIDEENFKELQALGCKAIELTERDTGKKYAIGFETFKSKAVPRRIEVWPPFLSPPEILEVIEPVEPAAGDAE